MSYVMVDEQQSPNSRGLPELKEWGRGIAKEVERLNHAMTALSELVTQLRIEVGKLNVKAAVGGFLAGLLPTAVFYLIQYLMKVKP